METKLRSTIHLKSSEPFVIRYITFDTIKLLDQNGQFHNQIKTLDAQKRALDIGLDLVCFNKPNGNDLAFCKLIDFNKWKYDEEKRKKKEAKENKRESKEIRLSPNIADNDVKHKIKQVNEFLDDGDDVALIMKLRGREKIYFTEAETRMNMIVGMCDGHGREVFRKKTGDLIIVRLSKVSQIK